MAAYGWRFNIFNVLVHFVNRAQSVYVSCPLFMLLVEWQIEHLEFILVDWSSRSAKLLIILMLANVMCTQLCCNTLCV